MHTYNRMSATRTGPHLEKPRFASAMWVQYLSLTHTRAYTSVSRTIFPASE